MGVTPQLRGLQRVAQSVNGGLHPTFVFYSFNKFISCADMTDLIHLDFHEARHSVTVCLNITVEQNP